MAITSEIHCPVCGHDRTDVSYTRRHIKSIRRRRKCCHCHAIFDTVQSREVVGTLDSVIRMFLRLNELPGIDPVSNSNSCGNDKSENTGDRSNWN